MSLRAFYALEVAEPLAQELKLHLKRFSKIPGVNWVSELALHLTLLFMAEAPFDKMQELKQLCLDLSQEYDPASMISKGIELFPSKEPRLAWVKMEAENDGIFELYKSLQKRCLQLGIDFDKKALKPHITLGRIKRALPASMERDIMQTQLSSQSLTYDTLTLYSSKLGPHGPKYTILEQSKLQKRR